MFDLPNSLKNHDGQATAQSDGTLIIGIAAFVSVCFSAGEPSLSACGSYHYQKRNYDRRAAKRLNGWLASREGKGGRAPGILTAEAHSSAVMLLETVERLKHGIVRFRTNTQNGGNCKLKQQAFTDPDDSGHVPFFRRLRREQTPVDRNRLAGWFSDRRRLLGWLRPHAYPAYANGNAGAERSSVPSPSVKSLCCRKIGVNVTVRYCGQVLVVIRPGYLGRRVWFAQTPVKAAITSDLFIYSRESFSHLKTAHEQPTGDLVCRRGRSANRWTDVDTSRVYDRIRSNYHTSFRPITTLLTLSAHWVRGATGKL